MHGIIGTRPSDVKRRLVHCVHRVISLIIFLNLITYGHNGHSGRDSDPGLCVGLALERVQLLAIWFIPQIFEAKQYEAVGNLVLCKF